MASTQPPQPCADAGPLDAAGMTGIWHAIFGAASESANGAVNGPVPVDATLEIGPHPEYTGSLRGSATRGAARSLLAGDVDDDGELLLEESSNGKTIAATWTGHLADGSCGQTIEGTWNDALTSTNRPFTLRRLAAGQPAPPGPPR